MKKARQMHVELLATDVSYAEDAATVVLAFSAREDDAAQYIVLQYALQTDEQDKRLRTHGLYIERDDQAFGCYHGVETIRRIGDRLEIVLTVEGKRRLQADRIVIAPVHWSSALDRGMARLAELVSGDDDVRIW